MNVALIHTEILGVIKRFIYYLERLLSVFPVLPIGDSQASQSLRLGDGISRHKVSVVMSL